MAGDDDVFEPKRRVKNGAHKLAGFFKLANENEMGGLNDLMSAAGHGNQANEDGLINDNNNNNPGERSGNGMNYGSDEMMVQEEPFSKMRDHATHMQMELMKRKSSDSEQLGNNHGKRVRRGDDAQSGDTLKVGRACKGKKYQEFIKHAKMGAVINSTPIGQNRTKPIGFPHNGYCKQWPANVEEDIRREERPAENVVEVVVPPRAEPLEDKPDSVKKLFDATDFALDGKINALPALSLDLYVARKKATKKKKKIGGEIIDVLFVFN